MRLLSRLTLFALATYVVVLAAAYSGQRYLLFANYDDGGLVRAGGIAIKGSSPVTIKTTDGEQLAAWYVAPRNNQPVFLFFHGKGGSLEVKKWRWQRIIKKGAGILAFSYRGYPGSSGSPSETGLAQDAEAAYTWLTERHPPNRIILHGLSLGTGVATTLATKVNALALVLEAPFTAVVDVAAERYPFLPVHWLQWDRFASRDRIAAVNMPVLIAHGTRDSVVPFHHGKQLYHLAKQPKQFIAMQGSDHSTLVRDGLYPHIWRFIEKHR